MKKVSDIYAGKVNISEVAKCPIKSEQAKRALALFPSKADCTSVLQPASLAFSTSLASVHEDDHVTFE